MAPTMRLGSNTSRGPREEPGPTTTSRPQRRRWLIVAASLIVAAIGTMVYLVAFAPPDSPPANGACEVLPSKSCIMMPRPTSLYLCAGLYAARTPSLLPFFHPLQVLFPSLAYSSCL